jgi:uncharacterized protein
MSAAKFVISVRSTNEVNIEGRIVVDGFPSAGLANVIACECIIRSTRTKVAAVLVSPDFPVISIISDCLPQFPARIYLNEDLKIAFFITEINIDKSIYREMATTMIPWALDYHCKLIISAAGAPTNKEREQTPAGDDIELYGVSSTESSLSIIREHGFSLLKSGTISVIPASC